MEADGTVILDTAPLFPTMLPVTTNLKRGGRKRRASHLLMDHAGRGGEILPRYKTLFMYGIRRLLDGKREIARKIERESG